MAKFVFVALLMFAGSASAALVTLTTNTNGAAPLTPSWTAAADSLIAGLVPSTASGNFSQEISGRNVNTLTAGGTLTITSVGSPATCSINYVTCGNGSGAGSTIAYTLPASASGYNLTNITVYSGWQDNGRDAQAYTVSYSTAASPTVFTVLASVNYNPSVPNNIPSANRVILADSTGGLIASNVAIVKFDFTNPASENGYTGYGAITVEGTAATNLPPPQIIITTANQNSANSFTATWPIENNSLIAGQMPSAIGSGNFAIEPGVAGYSVLTDGRFGSVDSKSSYATCGSLAGQSVTYALGGASITNIVVYSGWPDNGRDGQYYNILYSSVSAPATFILLTNVSYNPAVSGVTANRVSIATSTGAPLATNVASIMFDFSVQSAGLDNGYSGYAEIIITGTTPPEAPILTRQPQPITVFAGATANFSLLATGTQPFQFQWQYITNNVTNILAGATNASLTISNVTVANAGSYQCLVSNSLGSTASSLAGLTVIPVVPGSYSAVILAGNPLVYWKLNETNNPATGGAVAYDYVNGYNGVYQSGAQNGFNGITGPRSPAFAGFPADNSAVETFANTPNSFMTASAGNLAASNLTYTMWIKPSGPVPGFSGLLMDRGAAGEGFGFGNTADGNGVSELAYTWNQNTTSSFDSFLFPPINQWSFVAMVISPTQAVLYLINANGIQAATNNIAHDTEQFGVAWHLGDDGVYGGGVRTFPGSIDEVAVFTSALSQSQIVNLYYTGAGTAPVVSIPTASPSTNLFVGDSVILAESALGAAPLQYQWEMNGSLISGATNSSLALTNVLLTASGNYQVIVSNSYGAGTSAAVMLTVTLDTNPPVMLRAFNIGATNVEADFSKTVEAASATNPANYFFTNGLVISTVSLASNNASVLFTTAPMAVGSNYTLVASGIRDRSIPPNPILSNSAISFTASPFAPVDIGNPAAASTDTYGANGLSMTSLGYYIGGNTDQFNFAYQLQNGNFDVAVCLAGLSLSDLWAEAGLMARATLDPGSVFAASLATPGLNGEFFSDRTVTNGLAVNSGNFPVNYPNSWLRLNRVGNIFTGYGSYDGSNWTQLGSVTIAMPAQIYLGLSVASHNRSQATLAQFLNYGATPANSAVASTLNPHEPLGPSSRKTGIVISEIMYKPAPRTDGANVEFLELYNSNPYLQDISSYQVTCADITYKFPPNTIIPGGGFFVLAASPSSMQSIYGLVTNVFGPYSGSLKKSETLQLLDEQTNVLLTIPYTATYPWPVSADGTGHSIVLANPSYGEGDPRAWDISDVAGGSPGRIETFHPSPLRTVVINEILPHAESPGASQFIELYNHSTNSVDISGCILTDDTTSYKFIIPGGTVIGPAGFVSFTQSQFGFTLNGAGETLYLIKPDGSRILDAVQFGAQANGVSYGRWPDGANDFYAFTTNTPGTNNSSIVIGDIVINELMYDPISGNDDDQYIELFNQGTNSINLAGWQFTSGVTFTFPTITIAPSGYLVVARNLTNLFAKYPNLNSVNTVGNYSGKLSHNGELLVLSMPQTLNTNTPIMVAEDQVTYSVGGRWGEWSSGGGSSLELIDPRANHRLAANWADSNESPKSAWTNIEFTGVLDNGANFDPSIDYAQIGLLDTGECLVDNLEVNDTNGVNYISNGTFEAGTNGWSFQGCMTRSTLENTGYSSGHSLHIRCSDRLWTGVNSCQVALNPNSLAAGQTATLRFKARWLHGWPEALLRLNGNWLEATAALPIPNNLGTPGGPNSQAVTNAPPAVYNATHAPSLPAAGQAAVISAQVSDPNGLQNLTLYYRLDPATTYTAVPMTDNGAGGDAIAGDGIFSATIPGQAANQIVAYYISATDSQGATSRFPALRPNDNEPVRECLVMFGDSNPGGSFGVYHLWLTQANIARWASLSDLRNEGTDGTFVSGTRVIYNMQGRFAGSPAHQVFDTPVGNLCHYKWIFNDDDQYLGATDFNKIHQPGNSPGDDTSIQREQLANTFLRTLGVPWLYKRYVAVYVNGNRRGTLMEDTQVPSSDVVKEHFPNDSDGYLYKMQPWFEMAPFPSGSSIATIMPSWCYLMPYTTTGGVKKPARYRYMFQSRRTPDSDSNFTNVFSLVDAASSYGTPNYVANMENIANMENWMRVFAANHAAGNWDSFGAQNEQNMYGYIGALGTKYTLLMWDFNIVIGVPGNGYSPWAPGQNLFVVNSADPNTQNIYNHPTFRRMYWRALSELVNGPLNTLNSGPLLDAKFEAFTANGLNVEDPNSNIKPWLSQAQSSIGSQLAAVNTATFSVDPGVVISNNLAYVTGQAPINVAVVWINGAAYPLTWTSLTNWTIRLPLVNGTNQFVAVGLGINGQPIAGDSHNFSVVYNGTTVSPVGQIVINEIMCNPLIAGAQFVELYNNSTTTAFDLSGWQLSGLGYTFPSGSIIAPTNYLVLAGNGAAFAAAYGATNPVFDIFSGSLPASATLALKTAASVMVAEVQYDSQLPWPTNSAGASLQLIDSRQDNWRVGNWSMTPHSATPGARNTSAASLTTFPTLWLNEVQADNITGITNRAGQHTPWLELFNPGTNAISLSGLYLANNYTNLLQWAFPPNTSIGAGQFKVIFADTQTNLSTTNELHTSFILPTGSGFLALTRLATNGQQQVLDYLNYQNIALNDSFGSLPDGQSFNREEFFQATPGASNNGTALPPASFINYTQLGSVYTQNFDALPDPGASSVNTANPVLINGVTYSLANPYDFAFPVMAAGNGGLGLSSLAGWYGSSGLLTRFGAADGDQTTGGQLSFGAPNSSNRALGLLATSTTAATAFGVRFINETGTTLNRMNVQVTGEVWRQSNLAKTLQFYYSVDPSGTAVFPPGATAYLPALNVNFPTVPGDSGGVAVDGTSPLNQTNLSVLDQAITNWPPGAALWLVWQMTDSTGKAQGLAIDNFKFSASIPLPVPLSIQTAGTNLILNWPTAAGQTYQLEYKTELTNTVWTPLGGPVTGNGSALTLTNSLGSMSRQFFRLRLVN